MKKIVISSVLTALLASNLFAKDVSSYEYAPLKSNTEVKSALSNNGFSIIGEYDAMKNPNYHVIAFTNDAMKNAASQENRGFAGVQKVLIDKKDNTLVFTNPEYFMHAFLQDDFKENIAQRINAKLSAAFGKMTASKDVLESDDIAGYHFMMAMPYYEDMIQIGKGTDLVQNIKKNAGKNLIFELNLKNSVLLGVAMPTKEGESYYLPKIKGEKHAAFLPYMILVENNKAEIMHPKYYLAIAFPELSMGEFMAISSTPGAIEDYMTGLVSK